MGQLPIVKYEGRFWFFDERLNELRDMYTAERQRLDSGMIEKHYFKELIIGKQKAILAYDADKTEEDENHVPVALRGD